MQFRKQSTGAQPLDQSHLYLLLLAHRGGEAKFRDALNFERLGAPYSAAPAAHLHEPGAKVFHNLLVSLQWSQLALAPKHPL
jgi:hypothetical protein